MPLESAMGERSGLIPYQEWLSRQEDEARKRPVKDEKPELTEEEQEQLKILRYCANLYESARKAREPHETFDVAWDLFIGNTWPRNYQTWRAKITINKIRAFITFMAAVMTDNKPRISVEPRMPGSEDAADLLRKLVDRDWDENNMQDKLETFVLFGLIWGTAFMKITYNPYANGGRGAHLAVPVAPYRVFTNETATCIEDAEYLIHVDRLTMGYIRREFPTKANAVWAVRGNVTSDKRERDRDFSREGAMNETQRIISAQNVNGNISGPQFSRPDPQYMDDDGDTVEVIEYWLRDETLVKFERQKIVGGKPQTKPVLNEDGSYVLETVGQRIAISEIDGQPFMYSIKAPKREPVMETAWRMKYPNGRLVLIAAGRVTLQDIPAPFQTDGFPWAMWKNYNVGGFWGHGEPLPLKDTQIAINKIASQVYEILEKTGNPSFMLKKGAGVNAAGIKNKPGAIIPMDELDAIKPLEKPPMPPQFLELFTLLRGAMGEIAGVNDAVMGANPSSNTAFATVDQLQESGSAPIRGKVRRLETGITRIGRLRIQLIQQFDNGLQPIRKPDSEMEMEQSDEEGAVVPPASDTESRWTSYTRADLQGAVEFGVVPISSLSTSPAGAWQKWMTMYEKHLVDRRWWHDHNRIEGYRTELPRMEKQEAADAAQQAAAKDGTKPGPAPKSSARNAHRRKAPATPQSHVPTARDKAAVR